MRARMLAIAVAVALATTHAVGAHAQPASPQAEEEEVEPPPPPPASSIPQAPRPPTTLRLALVGDYRSLYDLSVLAAGVDVSLGCACEKVAGAGDLRLTTGRTRGGLSVTEVELGATVEFPISGGMFLGLGGGLTLFSVQRATTGNDILSVGPELFGRVGYRFATRWTPYVTIDFGSQLQSNWTPVWGPTLAVGYRL